MRLWLSRNSAASLREQLTTQIRLGIVSGDLRVGDRLPSVRDVARRYGVHSNTVSAAYRDLEAQGWLEFRKGSGVYTRDLQETPLASPLDAMVQDFLSQTRARGFTPDQVRASLMRALGGATVRRLLVAEPEPELRSILVAELTGKIGVPVSELEWRDRVAPVEVQGAAVTAMTSRASAVRAALPAGAAQHFLKVRSLAEHFANAQRPPAGMLIGVASSSPEILRRVRTLLLAVGLHEDGLEFRDARESAWSRGLHACAFVITDVVTARRLPKGCTARELHVLSETSIEELRQFLALVTVAKVS